MATYIDFTTQVLILIISLVIHENAHARMAYILGDDTAKNMGRFSLNPLKHLHPVGTVLPFIMYFFKVPPIGFARPVKFNHYNFKHPIIYTILTAFAGPLANLVIAVLALLLFNRLIFLPVELLNCTNEFIHKIYYINAILFFFNLLPIPPMDGSRLYISFILKYSPKAASLTEWFLIGVCVAIVFNTDLCKWAFNIEGNALELYFSWCSKTLIQLLMPVLSTG